MCGSVCRPDLSRFLRRPAWSVFHRGFARFTDTREPPSGSATPPRIVGPLELDEGFSNPVYDVTSFEDGNVCGTKVTTQIVSDWFITFSQLPSVISG